MRTTESRLREVIKNVLFESVDLQKRIVFSRDELKDGVKRKYGGPSGKVIDDFVSEGLVDGSHEIVFDNGNIAIIQQLPEYYFRLSYLDGWSFFNMYIVINITEELKEKFGPKLKRGIIEALRGIGARKISTTYRDVIRGEDGKLKIVRVAHCMQFDLILGKTSDTASKTRNKAIEEMKNIFN
jgi:hypothetical protein